MKTRITLLSITILFNVLSLSLTAFAIECADTMECGIIENGEYRKLGEIQAATCWLDGKGCRPWHCDGKYQYTHDEYWKQKCAESFFIADKDQPYVKYPQP